MAKTCNFFRKQSSTQILRRCALVWLVLSQFPLPMLHSHAGLREMEQLGGENGHLNHVLLTHVQTRHRGEGSQAVDHPCGWHWHWIMPSDFQAECMGDPGATSFCLGLWSCTGGSFGSACHPDLTSAAGQTGPMSLQDTIRGWVGETNKWSHTQLLISCVPRESSARLAGTIACHSFVQSFIGVSFCAIACVILR